MTSEALISKIHRTLLANQNKINNWKPLFLLTVKLPAWETQSSMGNPLHSNISMHILHTVFIYFLRC